MIGLGNTAGLANFGDHPVGRRSVGALPLSRATQVVDQHFRALPCEQQRMGTPQATTGPCDDHDFIFEAHRLIHGQNSSRP